MSPEEQLRLLMEMMAGKSSLEGVVAGGKRFLLIPEEAMSQSDAEEIAKNESAVLIRSKALEHFEEPDIMYVSTSLMPKLSKYFPNTDDLLAIGVSKLGLTIHTLTGFLSEEGMKGLASDVKGVLSEIGREENVVFLEGSMEHEEEKVCQIYGPKGELVYSARVKKTPARNELITEEDITDLKIALYSVEKEDAEQTIQRLMGG
jgi:hypothetical protein